MRMTLWDFFVEHLPANGTKYMLNIKPQPSIALQRDEEAGMDCKSFFLAPLVDKQVSPAAQAILFLLLNFQLFSSLKWCFPLV